MSSLIERLRRALPPHYEIVRQLDDGGMGAVFLATDTRLERPVAIKLLRPELATERAVERFLREARILAGFSHPNIVAVHDAGEADGLFYYVMEYVEGETLAARIARERLTPASAVAAGVQLLDGLEQAHAAGIVHRDIKPSNVFLVRDRVLLGDFGIAKAPPTASSETRTAAGQTPGTPAYMPPEQTGGEATPRTDLYAVGMLLYEAMTGRRWSTLTPPDRVDWSGVPRRLVPVLRRALAWSPEERWPDAAAFRAALSASLSPRRARLMSAGGSAAVLVMAAAVLVLWTRQAEPDPPASDLAVVPFQSAAGAADPLARDLASLTARHLEGLPGLRLGPRAIAFRVWDRGPPATDDERDAVRRELGAEHLVWGTVLHHGYELEAEIRIDGPGGRRPVISRRGSVQDPAALAEQIAVEIVRLTYPGLADSYRGSEALSENLRALTAFLLGEAAVHRNAWARAELHFRAAVEHDPAFLLASWWLATVQRWQPTRSPQSGVELRRLYEAHGAKLGTLDRLLIEAELAPPGPEQFRLYEEAIRRYPQDGYARLLYGDQLFHRGPLFGVPLERAAAVLEEATTYDPFLAPAYEHAAWAFIRLDDRAAARRSLHRLAELVETGGAGTVETLPLLEVAYRERFGAAAPGAGPDPPAPPTSEALMFGVRAGASSELQHMQLAFGRAIAGADGAGPAARANGMVGQALALFSFGRAAEALPLLDSAAVLLATPEADIERAAWRVLPPALGWEAIPAEELRKGRAQLERWADHPRLGARVAWILAVDAYAAGDTALAGRWRARLAAAPSDTAASLGALLAAFEAAARGRYADALELTAPLTGRSVGGGLGDPFARSALYLKRAEWSERVGDLREAELALLWSENIDMVGWPGGELQAAEVDWALGVYGSYRRALTAARHDDDAAACKHFQRVLSFWAEADPPLAPLVAEAAEGAAGSCTE